MYVHECMIQPIQPLQPYSCMFEYVCVHETLLKGCLICHIQSHSRTEKFPYVCVRIYVCKQQYTCMASYIKQVQLLAALHLGAKNLFTCFAQIIHL